jgi:ankyrin repeat protein
MKQTNTPKQIEFFRDLASGDLDRIRRHVGSEASLLNSFNYRGFGATPLTSASFSGRFELAKELLELGADPNQKSDWDMGPWSPLHCALFRRDKRLVELLLSHGATLDVHTAAGMGNCNEASRLLTADPSRVAERGGDGCYPLHFADTCEVARLLLDRGADIDGRCIDHYSTPVQYLCTIRPEVAKFLLAAGATPDIFSAVLCGDVSCVEKLLEAVPNLIHARINQVTFPSSSEHDVQNILNFSVGNDSTPLHAAAKSNRFESVPLLVRCGLSVDVRGGYDLSTPLHTAAWSNCPDAAAALLDNGADIDIRSGKLHNNSPAGWAIVAGSDRVFELLLDRGATVYEWFVDDARDACDRRFDQVSNVPKVQRERILSRLIPGKES